MLHSRLRPLPRKSHPAHNANAPEDKDYVQQQRQAPNPDLSYLNSTEYEIEDEDNEDSEDIFSAFIAQLFPEDTPQFHGDPGQLLQYESPLYGPLTIMVPDYPDSKKEEIPAGPRGHDNDNQRGIDAVTTVNSVDQDRKLFAHYLWSSALVIAQEIEDADAIVKKKGSIGSNSDADKTMFSVKGHRVLELGAGAGLPSIISVLASASHVTVTDHPSSPAFSGAIRHNIMQNIPKLSWKDIEAVPHEWGVLDENDPFVRENRRGFTRIIAADCIWMLYQHENLVNTLLWFLSTANSNSNTNRSNSHSHSSSGKDDHDEEGRVWVVAGFHSGRAIVAHFFETAVQMGLEIETIYERDLNEDMDVAEEGQNRVSHGRRAWEEDRDDEGPENRKRWCAIAVLKRARMTNL